MSFSAARQYARDTILVQSGLFEGAETLREYQATLDEYRVKFDIYVEYMLPTLLGRQISVITALKKCQEFNVDDEFIRTFDAGCSVVSKETLLAAELGDEERVLKKYGKTFADAVMAPAPARARAQSEVSSDDYDDDDDDDDVEEESKPKFKPGQLASTDEELDEYREKGYYLCTNYLRDCCKYGKKCLFVHVAKGRLCGCKKSRCKKVHVETCTSFEAGKLCQNGMCRLRHCDPK